MGEESGLWLEKLAGPDHAEPRRLLSEGTPLHNAGWHVTWSDLHV